MKDKFEILQDIVGERLKNQWALSLPDLYELLKEVEIRHQLGLYTEEREE